MSFLQYSRMTISWSQWLDSVGQTSRRSPAGPCVKASPSPNAPRDPAMSSHLCHQSSYPLKQRFERSYISWIILNFLGEEIRDQGASHSPTYKTRETYRISLLSSRWFDHYASGYFCTVRSDNPIALCTVQRRKLERERAEVVGGKECVTCRLSKQLQSFLSFPPLHGCQMATAKFLERMCLALRAWRAMAPLRCAAKFAIWQPLPFSRYQDKCHFCVRLCERRDHPPSVRRMS